MISYYYGQCGFACVIYYRRYLFKSFKNFVFVGLLPLIGGLTLAYLFVHSLMDMTKPTTPTRRQLARREPGDGASASALLLLGLPLMFWWNTP